MRLNFIFNNKNETEKFHKNLFLDDIETIQETDQEFNEDDEYIDDDEYQPKSFKVKNLSLPLTDTIAEFVQDLSQDKFFLNDLSFIFEMSRKRAISPYAIVVALLYLKRMKSKMSKSKYNKNFSYWSCYSAKSLIDSYFKPQVNETESFTNTELCLISILLASKFLIDEGEDDEIYNDQWAEAADLPVKKVNKLEKMFLKKMDWELFVSAEEFWNFTNEITEKATRKKVKLQLGNCTYSDLDALLSFSKQFSLVSVLNSFKLLLKIFFVCSSTLLYVTLSTYLVSTSVILIKNSLVQTGLDLANGNNTVALTNNSYNIRNENNLVENKSHLDVQEHSDQSLDFKSSLDNLKSKYCKKRRMSQNLTKFSIDSNFENDNVKQNFFVINDIFYQTMKLIF